MVEALTVTGCVREPTKLYWDVRPSTRQPTLEFRVADVCMEVDEAVMVAGLARALAFTGHQAAARGEPVPTPRPELLRATVARGTGAARRRAELRRTGRLEAVVDLVAESTAR
jgi:gamma-glutamyl:cysteine ligase YbdK (ATP-grasp superfamily)